MLDIAVVDRLCLFCFGRRGTTTVPDVHFDTSFDRKNQHSVSSMSCRPEFGQVITYQRHARLRTSLYASVVDRLQS